MGETLKWLDWCCPSVNDSKMIIMLPYNKVRRRYMYPQFGVQMMRGSSTLTIWASHPVSS